MGRRASRITTGFADRHAAGVLLADALERYRGRPDTVVMALPRGGVPVGYEVARALHLPLDVLLVRKLGAPGQEELAMGAVAFGGERVLNPDVVAAFGLRPEQLDQVTQRAEASLARQAQLHRGSRPPTEVAGKTVIVVDDGLATGATMRAALAALAHQGPAQLVVAVPVGARGAVDEVAHLADDVACVLAPEDFQAVGRWYRDFDQTTDDEVRALLDDAQRWAPVPEPAGGAAAVVRRAAHLLDLDWQDADPLAPVLRDAHLVLIGEACAGSHELAIERSRLTRRLIEDHGFDAVAVAADWPDAARVNRYVHGVGEDRSPAEALGSFERFPGWVWRNEEMADFTAWLRTHNEEEMAAGRPAVAIYGLDLHCLSRSVELVLHHLEQADPAAAARARERYACLDHVGECDGQAYEPGAFGAGTAEEDEVIARLVAHAWPSPTGPGDEGERDQATGRAAGASVEEEGAGADLAADERFRARRRERLAGDAASYHRTLFEGRVPAWNQRDRHLAATLEALADDLAERRGRRPRMAVWADCSHVGDARATQLADAGELSLGQLVRQRHGDDAVLVGCTTYAGTVTDADAWGTPARSVALPPARVDSYESLFHDTGLPAFTLALRDGPAELVDALATPRLERTVGAVYRPATERDSHYLRAALPSQLDAVIHVDETTPVRPLPARGSAPTDPRPPPPPPPSPPSRRRSP